MNVRTTLLALLCVCLAASVRGGELARQVKETRAKYGEDLARLADWCAQRGLEEQAKTAREWLLRPDPLKIYLAAMPREVGPAAAPEGASEDALEARKRFLDLRAAEATTLYELARKCIRARRASLAYELILQAGREDPDNEAVRRVLGYQKFRGGWYTAYEAKKLRAGMVWHEKFGWLTKVNVARYESGKRFVEGKWITAEEDAKKHRDIESGWDIETEHYTIRTDHSIPAGVALGEKLEILNRFWQQIFIRYFATEAQVTAMFDGRPKPPAAEGAKLGVVYFRDRDDYNRSLKAAVPNIEISVGFYQENMKRAYFFAGKDSDDRTLYHEATHQLFHQSRPVARDVGAQANFWIVEGIAMFMESLRRDGDWYTLGGADDVRLQAARYRLLHDDFYVPFAEMTGYGMAQIQKDPRIATLYSQMAGQTHFLIFFEDGRYRDALVSYLTLVYNGRIDSEALAKLTGTGYREMDQQYRKFISGVKEE